MRITTYFLLTFVNLSIYSQARISISELFTNLVKLDNDTLIVDDKSIYWDVSPKEILKGLSVDQDDSGRYIINKRLIIRNSTFTENEFENEFQDIAFKGGLEIIECQAERLRIENCQVIDSNIDVQVKQFAILNCNIERVFVKIDNSSISDHRAFIFGSVINDELIFTGEGFLQINLWDNQFLAENRTLTYEDTLYFDLSGRNIDYGGKASLDISFKEVDLLQIRNNQFLSKDSTRSAILVNYCNIDHFQLEDNVFDSPVNISYSNFKSRVDISHNAFNDGIAFSKVVNPEFHFNFDWDQIVGKKLMTFIDLPGRPLAELRYQGTTEKELQNNDGFRQLLDVYAEFYNKYKENGDILGANGVYRELQDLYTGKYEFLNRTNPSLQNWFRWRLNQLIGFYTYHGTQPARSMVISFYIVLGFTFVYFLFPSDWDRLNLKSLYADFDIIRAKKGVFAGVLSLSGLMLIHLLNSFMLSVNSFVTLGFGKIPTRGLPRYLCILEGFVGWFLLSLFMVALFSQVSL